MPHDSLRLFMLCKAMEWNHLPASGGLFDQDPRLLDDWQTIWQIEGAAQERQQAADKRDAERNAPGKNPRTVSPI